MRVVAPVVLVALLCSLQTTCSTSRRAIATRISTDAQRIGGPKALGQVGDYLLENDKIRLIVHGPGPNRANTVFAGSLIDADLQRPQGSRERGRDQLQELLPAFVFEVLDPKTNFTVTRDGADGGPAVLTLRGEGGDAFQSVALLNTGLLFPQNLEFEVAYILEPGKNYVTIETTVINNSNTVHPLPFLDPPDLRELGLDIPGLDELTLSSPFGHFVIIGQEQSPFMPGLVGYNVSFGIEELLGQGPGLPAFPGAVGDFFASSGPDVSYGLTVPSGENNYVNAFRDLYSTTQPVTDFSLVAPFYFAGTVGAFHTIPPRELEPGDRFIYTSYFIVGRGDVASVGDTVYELQGVETGTVSGRITDDLEDRGVAGASLVVRNDSGAYVSQLTTDADGHFKGNLPPGSYEYQLVQRGRETTAPASFDVRANQTTYLEREVPPTSRIAVFVTDTQGRELPCKITLVGEFDPANRGRDPREFLYDLEIGEPILPIALDDSDNRYIEHTAYAADGRFNERARPGEYELIVSRGMEYDLHRERITLRPGEFLERRVSIERSVDTSGYVAIDTHLHAVNSPDSGMTLEERVISIAGEGVEYAVATDHNAITDYGPAIARTGLDLWLVSSVGTEVTTFEMGHFNGFPLLHDSSSVRGGEILWAGYDPGEIFDQIRDAGRYSRDETIVQLNHPRWEAVGYFNNYNFDQDFGDVVGLDGLRAVFSPFSDEFSLQRYSWDFDAVELIGGKRQDLVHNFRVPEELPPPPIPPEEDLPPAGEVLRTPGGAVAFPGVLEDWFVLLNQGRRFVGVGTSDSHDPHEEAGFARSYVWVGEGRDRPGAFSERDVVAGLRAGRAIATTGPMIELFVNGEPIGSDVIDTDGSVEVELRVRTANWMTVDRAIVYANGEIVIDEAISSNDGEVILSRTVDLSTDSWLVLEVTGPTNLFPVISPKQFRSTTLTEIVTALGSSLDLSALDPFGNLQPQQAQQPYPMAISNPIWVDVDGNGEFDASESIPTSAPRQTTNTDVRETFRRLGDGS